MDVNATFNYCRAMFRQASGLTGLLKTVVRNLPGNSVKVTAQGGKVSLQITEAGGKYVVVVSDTVTGMTQEQLQNLFRIDCQQSRPGKDDYL